MHGTEENIFATCVAVLGELGLHVDGGGEVLEGRGVLLGLEVHQPEVERGLPLKRVEVPGVLEACRRESSK